MFEDTVNSFLDVLDSAPVPPEAGVNPFEEKVKTYAENVSLPGRYKGAHLVQYQKALLSHRQNVHKFFAEQSQGDCRKLSALAQAGKDEAATVLEHYSALPNGSYVGTGSTAAHVRRGLEVAAVQALDLNGTWG